MSLLKESTSLKRILLVDDSEFDREKVIRALKVDPNARYEFQELEEGEKLERVALDWCPHLVILDFSLPAFNGLDLLKQLVEKYGKLPVPFIMATGRGDEATAVEAMKLGALDYVVKDGLSPDEVRQVVRRALQKSSLQQSLFEQQKLLEESQHRLELALSASGMGIWEWDIHSDRLYLSPQAESILELPLGPTGRSYSDFLKCIYADDRDGAVQKITQAIQSKTHYRHEFRIHLADGRIRWLSSSGKADYEDKGEPILIRGTLADVTEQRQIQIELQNALDKIKEEQGFRDRFVAILSHDLRNPLSSAKISLQLLARFPERAEVRAQIPYALMSLERADRMIQDLLDASSLKAGQRLPVQLIQGDLIALIGDTVRELTHVHGERFVFNIPDELLALPGLWSLNGLRRVLENLAGNAIKYGSQNTPVTISVKLDVSEMPPWVCIGVHNCGNPISRTDQSGFFDPFQRSHSAEVSGKEGWGLGLSLVRGIAEAHGGRTSVESSLEKGTTFWVFLPRDSVRL